MSATILTELVPVDTNYFPIAQVLLAEEDAVVGDLRVRDIETGQYYYEPFIDLVVPYQDGMDLAEFVESAAFTCMQQMDYAFLHLVELAAKDRVLSGGLSQATLKQATQAWESGTFGCLATPELLKTLDGVPVVPTPMDTPEYAGVTINDLRKVAATWAINKPEPIAYLTNSPAGVFATRAETTQYDGAVTYKFSYAMVLFANNVWAVKP